MPRVVLSVRVASSIPVDGGKTPTLITNITGKEGISCKI